MMDFFDTNTVERSIISTLLMHPGQFDKISSIVTDDDFSDVSLKLIFQTLVLFDKNKTEWTWQSVADSLKSIDKRPIDLEYPTHYISELISTTVCSVEDIDFHLKMMLEKRCRLEVKKFISSFSKSVDDPSKGVSSLYEEFSEGRNIFGEMDFVKDRVVDDHNLWSELRKDIIELSTTKFVGTGYNQIDEHLAWGFAAGQISVITGRPSMGKSTLRSNIQKNLADSGIHSITVTIEQSIRQEYFRLIALHTGLPIRKICDVNNWQEGGDFDKINQAIKHMSSNWPHTMIEPKTSFFVKDLKRVVVESRAKGCQPKVVFVDLFSQLDDINSAPFSYKAAVIQQKVIELAGIAKELRVHFCLVVQLGRLGKARELVDPREYLKESGAYEERADLIFLVERPAYYKPEEIEDNCIVIRILKQRDGGTKILKLFFNPESLLISDVKDSEEENEGLYRRFDKEVV